MGRSYHVALVWRRDLILDIDEVKSQFDEDWGYALADEISERDFLENLIEEIGLEELVFSLEDPHTWVEEYTEVKLED